MKQNPDQRMALSDDLFPGLLAGAKRCTIRAGKRDVTPGPLVFYSSQGSQPETVVQVTEVRHKQLKDLTDAEAQIDGAPSARAMAAALKRFYHDIGPDSMITVLLFDPPAANVSPTPRPRSGWFSKRR